MVFRMPRSSPLESGPGSLDGIHYELLQEQAAALQRLGERLERALETLRRFDAARAGDRPPSDGERRERRRLVEAAGEALCYFVVQREVAGLRDGEAVMRELKVPREVQLRMGIYPRRAS
jgi:hypothetical protein